MPPSLTDLHGCIPSDVITTPMGQVVRWVRAGDADFAEPFLIETLRRLQAEADRPQFITPVSLLAQVAPAPAPKALLFHHGRCGSTLVSNILTAEPGQCAISEPPAVGALLHLREQLAPHFPALLRGMLASLAVRQGTYAGEVVFKFTGSNVLFAPELRAIYPETPCFFIFRSPLDSITSFVARPPRWLNNAQDFRRAAGPDCPVSEQDAPELKAAYCLGRFMRAGLDEIGRGMIPIPYTQLPDLALTALPRFLGLSQSPEARAARLEAAGRHSHDPKRRFEAPPSEPKHYDPVLIQAHERYTAEPYARLCEAAKHFTYPSAWTESA